jgi:serine/threonine protein kinase
MDSWGLIVIILQIKREITIMKLVRHPYVVRLHEACYLFAEFYNLDIDFTVILMLRLTHNVCFL